REAHLCGAALHQGAQPRFRGPSVRGAALRQALRALRGDQRLPRRGRARRSRRADVRLLGLRLLRGAPGRGPSRRAFGGGGVMAEISIRKATEADLPDLLALYAQPDFNNGRVTSLDAAKATLARMATYPDFAAYCAEIDGEIVGAFSLMVIDNLAHWGMSSALVENVVVANGHQGGGIG